MYQRISLSANPNFKQFAVSPRLSLDHMTYLQKNKYAPIPVTHAVRVLLKKETIMPERPIVLTFDDGLADFFTEALPILTRYSFTTTLYVTTAFINGTSRWLQREGEATRPMLTWDQLTKISPQSIECGAHSHSHSQLDILPHPVAQDEIVRSKRMLEHHPRREVSSFAYPLGYYSARVRQQVQETGYTSACAVKHEMSSETSDPFALARLLVKADTNRGAFAALLTGHIPSVITTTYVRARTPVWQLVRRSSASIKRYLQDGLLIRW